MVIRASRFNFNLLLMAVLAAFIGCKTTKEEKVEAIVRVHLEVNPGNRGIINSSSQVPVYRAKPVLINVQKSPILSEAILEKAAVVDVLGGFALQIQFDHSGVQLLEQYSAGNPGKRLAVFCQFGEKMTESRWLAAPLIGKRITNGTLVFTPDCTREEADRIALGLNNFVTQRDKLNLIK